MIRIGTTMVLVLFSLLMFGQISVNVRADKDTINIGDEVEFFYKINVPEGVVVNALDFTPIKEVSNFGFQAIPAEYDSLIDIDVISGGAFEINNNNLIVSKERFQGAMPLAGSIKVRVSSAGIMKLPKPILQFSPGIQELALQTPQLFIRRFDEMEDINPNWSIIEEEITWRDYLKYIYIYLGIAAFLLSLYFVITYLRKGKKGFNIEKVEIRLPAEEVAIRDLNLLKEKELWQDGDTKGYHTELTRIMRQYIEDRYEVQALEMTSSQLQRELKAKEINFEIAKRFDDILQISDKVKFAKGSTGPELNVKFMDEAFQIVEETTEVKKENEEEK